MLAVSDVSDVSEASDVGNGERLVNVDSGATNARRCSDREHGANLGISCCCLF